MSREKKDTVRAKLGMWLFLLTEILLFGALFLLYAAYLRRYPQEFHHAGSEVSVYFGAANTVLLITSSFCVVLSILALRRNDRRRCLLYIAWTVLLGTGFLVNKSFEWGEKFSHGLYPNSPALGARPPGENMFYVLYFFMTGLHGLHVLVGIAVFSTVFALVYRQTVNTENDAILFNAGLYWHLVDIIWIYLFPLFYLIA